MGTYLEREDEGVEKLYARAPDILPRLNMSPRWAICIRTAMFFFFPALGCLDSIGEIDPINVAIRLQGFGSCRRHLDYCVMGV